MSIVVTETIVKPREVYNGQQIGVGDDADQTAGKITLL